MAAIATNTTNTSSSNTPPVAGTKVFREVERPSASLCDFTTRGSVLIQTDPTTNHRWTESKARSGTTTTTSTTEEEEEEDDPMTNVTTQEGEQQQQGGGGGEEEEDNKGRTPVVQMEPGTTVRVSPMEWKCNGWAEEHFHERLKLPDTVVGVGRGLVVTLEAMARECVAIALSPKPYFELGKTYAVHFGASCNLQTVIRRRIPSETTMTTTTTEQLDDDDHEIQIHSDEAVDTTVPTPQICTPHKFSSYWIALHDRGKLSVGLGTVPGMDCVATLDDSLYHALRSGPDAVRYVGIGNSALGRNARSLKVRNLRLMPLPAVYGESPKQAIPLRDWSILGQSHGKGGGGNGGGDGGDNNDDDEDLEDYVPENEDLPDGNTGTTGRDASMWIEYQKQCHKAKMRAKKFGTEYRQPPPDAFFKWSEARRLRANPERGFVTGIDILSAEEREKARKRKERFEEEERGFCGGSGGGGGGGGYGEDGGSVDLQTNAVDGGETVYSEWDASTIATLGTSYDRRNEQILPMKQAWDHFDLVRKHRVDPSPHLFHANNNSNGNSSNGEGDKTVTENGADGTTKEAKETSEGEKEETMVDAGTTEGDGNDAHAVLEKIHLFAIDWAAFKQIRTDDIMAYFADYGPSYVEWLGELSCNVLFEDKYTSARAIEAMSRPIPHPKEVFEPETVVDTAAVTATGGTTTTTTTPNEEETLPSPADANAPPPTNNQTKSKQLRAEEEENARLRSEELAVDLGSMGWRFCNRPIRKIQSNRFGRKGTRSRCLMRVATSLDVLEDRPTVWPKPPPGFTTTRVLGPGSDEVREKKRKRRRRSRKRGGEGHTNARDANGMDVDEESVEDAHDDDVGGGMGEDGEADAHDDITIDRGLKSSRPGFTVEQMEEERRNKAKKATAAA